MAVKNKKVKVPTTQSVKQGTSRVDPRSRVQSPDCFAFWVLLTNAFVIAVESCKRFQHYAVSRCSLLAAAAIGQCGAHSRVTEKWTPASASSDTIELAADEYMDSGPTIDFGSASGLVDITIAAASATTSNAVTIDRAYSGRLFKFTAALARSTFPASASCEVAGRTPTAAKTTRERSCSLMHQMPTSSLQIASLKRAGTQTKAMEDEAASASSRELGWCCKRVGKGGVGQDYYLSSSVATTFEDTLFDTGPNPVLISDGASGAAKDNSTLIMIGCTATGYRAALGVIIFSIDARGSIESSTFTNNGCVRGGAIMASTKPVFIRNCTFLNNVAFEGGVVYFAAASVSSNSIIDSHFEGNEAKSTGGAIRISGPATVTMTGCTFKANSAQGIGGGAIYLASDTTLLMENSTFEGNHASSGGAIWSEGKLDASNSVFRHNYLLTNDESTGDVCGVDAGAGGTIYSTLAAMLPLDGASATTKGNQTTTTAAVECKIDQLQLDTLTFEYNNASMNGGGSISLDQQVPLCAKTKELVCKNCIFTGNDAAYGTDVATIVNTLELRSKSLPSKWALVSGNDVSIDASDLLGQALQGSHPPLLVRLNLLQRGENGVANAASSPPTVVSLTTNISRAIRNGEAIFKALALRMAFGEANKVDHSLTLSFTGDTGAVHTAGGPDTTEMTLFVPIVLEKCAQDNGLLNPDGSCLVEASGGTDRVVAGIIFSVVVEGSFMFILYWSYKNSNRVMKTIQQLVTGVGSIVIKFFFELLDMASDVQALVNLFVFDVSLSHPTFVRVAYVTCYVLSVIPSVLLVHTTVQNIIAQWKRTKTRKIFARRNRVRNTENSIVSAREDTTETEENAKKDESNGNEMKTNSKMAFGAEKIGSKSVVDLAADPATLSKHSTRKLIDAYIKREIEVCEQELEYYRTHVMLMKRVLARLVTEDLLLLILNIYIYLANHSDETFLQSRFRSSLEFSIFMSAVNFGSQAQTIVTWLQINKVGEINRNLQTLKRLKMCVESTIKHLDIDTAKPRLPAAQATVSPVKKSLALDL